MFQKGMERLEHLKPRLTGRFLVSGGGLGMGLAPGGKITVRRQKRCIWNDELHLVVVPLRAWAVSTVRLADAQSRGESDNGIGWGGGSRGGGR